MQHIKPHQKRMVTVHIFIQTVDIGCILLEIRWRIMDVCAMVVFIMENTQHCIFAVQKRQMNILVRRESLNSKNTLHRVVVIS